MQTNQAKFELHIMARVLNVTMQAYRAWKRRGPSTRAREDALLRQEVKIIHENSKRTYGSPRVKAALFKQGSRVSRARVNRLMREANCETKYRKKFVRTTNSKHSSHVPENVLARAFKADRPNQKWVSDLTYLPTSEGWLYVVQCTQGVTR
jgi:putative transposase